MKYVTYFQWLETSRTSEYIYIRIRYMWTIVQYFVPRQPQKSAHSVCENMGKSYIYDYVVHQWDTDEAIPTVPDTIDKLRTQ